MGEHLYVAFAKFEGNQKEFERVRVIYRYALDRIPKQDAQNLFKNYTIFEKKFGDRRGIKDIIFSKRRFQYEEDVKANPYNYNAWFDYLRLLESNVDAEIVREVYETAIPNVPPPSRRNTTGTAWIKFAELETIIGDIDHTQAICELAISQPWLVMLEVLWKSYIDFEIEQEEYEKTRNLYRQLLQRTQHVKVWISLEQFELLAGQEERLPGCWQVFEEANKAMHSCEEKEERVMLVESWRSFEDKFGTNATQVRE
ncbi:hypothetical protein Nmel_012338 [Mimus melanotis]